MTNLPNYTNQTVLQFVEDMRSAGYDVEHYHGRFYWQGPAVRTDEAGTPSLQDVIRATTIPVQWDNMGYDWIVYPIASDERWQADRQEPHP